MVKPPSANKCISTNIKISLETFPFSKQFMSACHKIASHTNNTRDVLKYSTVVLKMHILKSLNSRPVVLAIS